MSDPQEYDHYHAGWGDKEQYEREEVTLFPTYHEAVSWCHEERSYEVSEMDPLVSWDTDPYWVYGCNEDPKECQKKSQEYDANMHQGQTLEGAWIAGKWFPKATDEDKMTFKLTWDAQGRVTIDANAD